MKKEGYNILKLMEEGLKQGALWESNPVGYLMEGSSSREMIGMQKLASKIVR